MKDKKKVLWFFILSIVPLLFTFLLGFSGITERLENSLIDFRHQYFNPNHKFSNKVVLIDFDESTCDVLGNNREFGRWPWKRSSYAPLLDMVASGGPNLILFDIMFFEISNTQEGLAGDVALGEITERMGVVSHSVQFRKDDLRQEEEKAILESIPNQLRNLSTTLENPEKLNLKKYNILQYPIDDITLRANHLHSVTYDPDADGVARRISLLFQYDTILLPSLSLKGFDAVKKIQSLKGRTNDLEIKLQDGSVNYVPLENGKMRLHYYSRSEMENIPRYSVAQVIESYQFLAGVPNTTLKIDPSSFTGKAIIIGTSAAATHDDKVTPYGNRPGFLLHAVAMSNLLEKHFLHLSPGWVEVVLLILTIPTCVFFSFFFQQMALRVFLPTTIFIGYTLLALIVFKFDIHLPLAAFMTTYPLAFLGALGYLSFTEGAERRKYSKVLSNMVDPSIVSEALNDLEALKKGGEREITAFFSDVAGFSTISEQLSSADLAALLNEYLGAMTIILKQNHGTLDKYIGDAVVGIFGAPITREEHFLESAKASLEMIAKLKELKKYWSENNLYCKDAQDMDVRIGLNTGLAKVGFMGTEALASYTMMGDTVNLAARLEAAGKDYGVNILISEFTNEKIKEKFFTRKLDWDKAITLFREAEAARGSKDKAVEMLIDRCNYYKSSPPGAEWDGVFTRKHK